MNYIKGYRLNSDTYLCLFDKFIAVVKVNSKGEIVKVSTFGKSPIAE